MKIEIITKQILTNYNRLSEIARVTASEEKVVPIWGLTYKKFGINGFVNQIGLVERNRSSIRIDNDQIHLQKKPSFLPWKRVLKKINNMLQNVIANYDNKKVVSKSVVKVLCFPKNRVARLSNLVK